jgi:DNA-binding CsgD family transcriptional regulator
MSSSNYLERWIDLTAHVLTLPADRDPMVDVCAEVSSQFDGALVGTVDFTADLARITGYRTAGIRLDYYATHTGCHPLSRHYLATGDQHARCLVDAHRFFREPSAAAVLAHARQIDGVTDVVYVPLVPLPGMTHRWLAMASSERLGEPARQVFDRLRELIRSIDAQGTVLTECWREDGSPTTGDEVGLTTRELVVLTLTADGLTAGAIADRLHISARTVSIHQQHSYAKLGVHDRLSAVLSAHSVGLLPRRRGRAAAPGVSVFEGLPVPGQLGARTETEGSRNR